MSDSLVEWSGRVIPVYYRMNSISDLAVNTIHDRMHCICSPRVMTAAFEHVIGSTVRDACGPAQEILDTITIESILNAG